MSGLEIKAMTDDGPDVITWFELQTTDADRIPVANWARVQDGKIQFQSNVAEPSRGPTSRWKPSLSASVRCGSSPSNAEGRRAGIGC